MPLRLLRRRSKLASPVVPYSRLLCVKVKSGKTFIVSSELWHLLPQGDEVVSILSANSRPIFAAMEPVRHVQLSPAR